MRHQVAGFKLSRSKDERDNLRRVLIGQLFEHERIKTTRTKALAIRSEAEKLITLAAKASKGEAVEKVNARRKAAALLTNPAMVKKLFDDIAPRYVNRKGGYTRIMKLGPRMGDSAEMVMLELIES
jgi:large subunit ribosomal protein L17